LDALYIALMKKRVNWVLDADIQAFFDTIDHEWLLKFIGHRIRDGRLLRQIARWLKAGVMEEGKLTRSEEGTPQGGSISPLLSNIYLHYVLDLWVEQWRKRQAHGDVIIVRYADDCAPRARSGSRKAPAARVTAPPMRERSLGICLQEPVPNHLRLLWSKAMVVSTRRKRLGKNRVRYATGS
jgi:hypothetical protein